MADLSVKGLKKSFGDHVVLKGVSFDVKSGDFLSLLGPSGCGKTTILRIICGLETADEGEVLVDGADVTKVRPEKRNIGLVFQNYALFPSMNVAKNVDEPLSALDRKVRAEMQYEIRNLQRQIGTTTVFVTHDQEEALTMSDQIILLHDGQIEQQGDPFTIYSQPASVFASDFLGKANLLSGVLACEDGVWCVCSENVRIPVNHVGGREGDTVKTAVRGEYFEFCTPETEGANPFHLEKKIFTGLSWKLIGTLGTQPLDISALGTHAGTLSEGDDLFVRIRPENVVYYNNN